MIEDKSAGKKSGFFIIVLFSGMGIFYMKINIEVFVADLN